MKPYLALSGFFVTLAVVFSISSGVAFAQTTIVEPAPPVCFSPIVNIRYGANDSGNQGAITSLQQFLVSQGYFTSANMGSGHFGPVTLKAVIAYQSANNLPATGYVGPLTRALMAKHCGGQATTNLSATPASGTSPLLVSFSGTGLKGGNQYIIDYGDGSNSGPLNAVNVCMGTLTNPTGCPKVGANHIYASTGTYTAALQGYIGCMWSNPRCMIATIPLGTATITVGTTNQQAVSINGLDAPSTLSIGQQGTWTVHVVANSSVDTLHYSVVWGDEQNVASSMMVPKMSTVNNSSTFTHTYQRSGTYTPVFTVTDDAGTNATVSNTITVSPLY
jgi:hypothetical protein